MEKSTIWILFVQETEELSVLHERDIFPSIFFLTVLP